MAFSRHDAVVVLWDDTNMALGPVVGAVAILERAKAFPVHWPTLQAAAWIAYKTYSTAADERLSYFASDVLGDVDLADGVKEAELSLLASIAYAVPHHTRAEDVAEFAHSLQLPDAAMEQLDHAVALSLLQDTCYAMDDAMYAKCVVFAAAYLATVAGVYLSKLSSDTADKDYIMQWGLRICRQ
jgi:hypothetical protein